MKIQNQEQLREIYGWPKGRAEKKVLNSLEKHARNFIQKSPFFILSSYDKAGRADASPRGGNTGFVFIEDDNHLIIPDSKGNNRVDSLINIVETGKIGLLFLIPGVDETLRINGDAEIRTDEKYLELFPNEKNQPKSFIYLTINEVFLHCAKALMRSELWNAENRIPRDQFPTMGRMLNEQLGTNNPLETQEEMVKRYTPDL